MNIDVSAFHIPASIIWTYGSDWANSKEIFRATEDGVSLGIAPPKDAKDLKFEVQYFGDFGIVYSGIARRHTYDISLSEFQDLHSKILTERFSLIRVLEEYKRILGAPITFSKCIYGVCGAWLESPRFTLSSSALSEKADFRSQMTEARHAFANGMTKPIVAEFIDPESSVWLALQISTVKSGIHRITAEKEAWLLDLMDFAEDKQNSVTTAA